MDQDPRATYFADVDEVWSELSPAQHDVVHNVRAILTRLDLRFARPDDATTTYDQAGGLIHLKIKHGADDAVVAVLAGPEGVVVIWPGGTVRRTDWDPHQADVLEAMLTGGNVIRSWLHGSKVVTADTEFWLPGRLRRTLPRFVAPGARAAVLRRLPWTPRRVDATLSFSRKPALAPPAKRDRV
jgi:hypothetical protein